MRKLIFHIGAGKTGTTSIQRFLNENRDLLQLQNIHYPDFLGPGFHPWLAFISFSESNPRIPISLPFLQESSDVQHPETRSKGIENKINQLKNWISSLSDSSIVIFSCEWLFDLSPQEIDTLVRIVQSSSELVAIIYLREPVKHLLSVWTQHTCNGFQEKLTDPYSFLTGPNSEIFEYRKILDNWEHNFAGRLSIRRFDARYMANGNLYSDFCEACGIEWDSRFYSPPHSNVSISWQSQKLLALINEKFPLFYLDGRANPLRGRLSEYFSDHIGEYHYYIPSLHELILINEHFNDYNNWLKEKYFPTDQSLWSSKVESRNPELDKYFSLEYTECERVASELIIKLVSKTHAMLHNS